MWIYKGNGTSDPTDPPFMSDLWVEFSAPQGPEGPQGAIGERGPEGPQDPRDYKVCREKRAMQVPWDRKGHKDFREYQALRDQRGHKGLKDCRECKDLPVRSDPKGLRVFRDRKVHKDQLVLDLPTEVTGNPNRYIHTNPMTMYLTDPLRVLTLPVCGSIKVMEMPIH